MKLLIKSHKEKVKIYYGIEEYNCNEVPSPIVTVGTFDGVHVGHQRIIANMVEEAHKINGETVLITFDPHPRLVLHSDSKDLKFINTKEKKFELLEKFGIQHLIIINFTREFAKTTSRDFIKNIIVEKLKTKKLIIGYDHQFGKNRLGDYSSLYDICKEFPFEVKRIPAQDVNKIFVSSTKIRKALNSGKIKKANELLGYNYSITGNVVRGAGIGRTIGYPTANIDIEDEYKLITANGVYACLVEYNGKTYKGMGNIGFRPTVDHGDLTIEVNIFDFDKDIYDESLKVFFIDRIRDEEKFINLNALKEQLHKDKANTLKILEE